jgi:hypothetical protein
MHSINLCTPNFKLPNVMMDVRHAPESHQRLVNYENEIASGG